MPPDVLRLLTRQEVRCSGLEKRQLILFFCTQKVVVAFVLFIENLYNTVSMLGVF